MSSSPLNQQDYSLNDFLHNYNSAKINSEADFYHQLRNLTEDLSYALEVDRVGVWLFDETKGIVRCRNLFDKTTNTHSKDLSVALAAFPSYLRLLEGNKVVTCSLAENHPDISAFWKRYLKDRNIKSLLNASIWKDGKFIGLITASTVSKSKEFSGFEKSSFSAASDLISSWLYQLRGSNGSKQLVHQRALKHLIKNFLDICSQTSNLTFTNCLEQIITTSKEISDAKTISALVLDDTRLNFFPESSKITSLSFLEAQKMFSLINKVKYLWISEHQRNRHGITKNLASLIGDHLGPCLIIPFGLDQKTHKNYLHKGILIYKFQENDSLYSQIQLDLASYASETLTIISEYVQTQRLYRESLEISRAAFENSNVGMILLNQEGLILKINQAAKEIFSYKNALLNSSALLSCFPEGQIKEQLVASLQGQLNNQFRLSTKLRSFDNSEKSVIIHVTPISLGTHKRHYLILQLIDITEKQQALEQLNRQQKFFKSIIDSSPNFVFAKDRGGRFILANKAVAEAYGTTEEGLIGKTDFDFNKNEEQVKKFLQDDIQVIESGKELLVHDEEVTDASGNLRYLYTIKRPLYSEELKDKIVLGVSTDVTARRKAEDEYKEWLHKLENSQKLESLGLLASGVAHDFNNILQGVIGNISLAKEIIKDSPHCLSLLSRALHAAEKASEITSQLLSYSGKGQLERKNVELSYAVQDTIELLERVSSKKVNISYQLSEQPLPILADLPKLHQVILNLVTNAIESFEDQKSNFNQIVVRTRRATKTSLQESHPEIEFETDLIVTRFAVLEVEDNGSGISEEALKRIFEPFFSTKLTGRGIGLAAVQGIIKSHQGYLNVSTALGKGSIFSVILPLSRENGSIEQTSKEEFELKPYINYREKPLNILIIDDEKIAREVCQSMLGFLGITSTLAKDGQKGLEIFQDRGEEFHAIVLDITMPRLDGLEAYEAIRKISHDIPVLFSSGFSLSQISLDFSSLRNTHFIQKPYTMSQFKDSLSELLNTKIQN